jgi:hypothetical protein
VGRGGFGVSKKAPLIDTSGEPVDTIDKFNVSPINDNVECRRSTALNSQGFIEGSAAFV